MTAYVQGFDPVGSDVHAARVALTEGLGQLRKSMYDMLSVTVRDEGSAKRTRNRPPGDTPSRHLPAGNTKPIGSRLAAPSRSVTPTRPGNAQRPASGGTDADTAIIPAVPTADDTVIIPAVAAADDTAIIPAVGMEDGPGAGGSPTGYPDQPDPTDPASEVWALVKRAQAGEAEAFGLIYDRYFDTVFRFIYFRVGNRQLAEDLTSETFLRALRRISSFSWQGRDLGAWLVTIARNLVADHFKSGRYRLEVTTGDVLDAEREDRGPEGSPEAAVVDHITNVALLAAVKRLNREQQECIILRFLQGFSVAETAKAMGKNEGAIKALQYRAVRALARLLPEGFRA